MRFLRFLRMLMCIAYLLIGIVILCVLPSELRETGIILFIIIGYGGYRLLFCGDGVNFNL